MTDKMTAAPLAELISRLEAATEGSRLLDAQIHSALLLDGRKISAQEIEAHDSQEMGLVAHYTTSLDAAMTLVQDGVWLRVEPYGPPHPESGYIVSLTSGRGKDDPNLGKQVGWACNRSLVRAVCIAALKARAAS